MDTARGWGQRLCGWRAVMSRDPQGSVMGSDSSTSLSLDIFIIDSGTADGAELSGRDDGIRSDLAQKLGLWEPSEV